MIKAINAVMISTADPKRLIEFYTKIGLSLKSADHGGGLHAETDYGDVHFAIWSGGQPSVTKSNMSFSLHVPNLEEYYEELVEKGVKFDHPPQKLPFGGVIAGLTDPDGNRLVLMRWDSEKL
jgi:predicted enzyme related to lactoylglutathione lyase